KGGLRTSQFHYHLFHYESLRTRDSKPEPLRVDSRQWLVADLMGLDRTTFWGDAVSELPTPKISEWQNLVRLMHVHRRNSSVQYSSAVIHGAHPCRLRELRLPTAQ